MRNISRTLVLLLTLAVLVGSMVFTASAASFESSDDALGYLDSYADNVGADEGFADKISEAIAVVQEEIGAYATFASLLPPIIAIALALLTKEVYSSLFIGIVSGALIYSNFNPWGMVTNTFDVMVSKLADSWNVGILIFLVVLGMMVSLVNKAGGSAAYGRWASKHIKTRAGAMVSTAVLGMLIFIDDYFNCLTVPLLPFTITIPRNFSCKK